MNSPPTLTRSTYWRSHGYVTNLPAARARDRPKVRKPISLPFGLRWMAFPWFILWAMLTSALIWPVLAPWRDANPSARPPTANGVNYLIIAPQGLESSAKDWAAYRRERGYEPAAFILPEETTAQEIRWIIQEIYHRSGEPHPFYVLLLGHAHPLSSHPYSYLPTDKLPLKHAEALAWGYGHLPGDGGYTFDPHKRAWLPISIGRVPALNDRFALEVLARVRGYETHPPRGEGRARLEIVTSSSNWGTWIDRSIERLWSHYVDTYLPAYTQAHVLTGSPESPYNYPLEDLPEETARRFDSGALLISYIGHGLKDQLGPAFDLDGSEGQLFNFDDLHHVRGASDSILSFVACDVGQFDLPGDQISLAEALLLFPKGPVATFAASHVTFPFPNAILEQDLLKLLYRDRVPTLGEWARQIRAATDNPGIDPSLGIWIGRKAAPYLHAAMITPYVRGVADPGSAYLWQRYAYNLFGDPGLELTYPQPELQIKQGFVFPYLSRRLRVSGQGDLPMSQFVILRLSLPASETPAYRDRITDKRFVYAQTNKKILAKTAVLTSEDGRFKGVLKLPRGLPPGRYILQAIAATADETLVGGADFQVGISITRPLHSLWTWWLLVTLILASPVFRFIRNRVIR